MRCIAALFALATCVTSAADALADEDVDPKLIGGASIATLGGAALFSSMIWMGTDDDALCDWRCEDRRDVGIAIGLGTGGLTAAIFGVAVAAASAEPLPANQTLRARTGAGVFFTGMCTAGILGSTASLAYLSYTQRDISALIGAALFGGSCAAGVAPWLKGLQPEPKEVRALGDPEEGWRIHSPVMFGVGTSMVVVGATLVPAGAAYGFIVGRRRPGVQGDPGIDWGLVTGTLFALPGTALVLSGFRLAAVGGTRVPPEWQTSWALAPGGLVMSTPLR